MQPRHLVRWTVPLLAVFTMAAAREVPLIDAVKKSDASAVRALLQKKVDVNATELDGSTALHWAVHKDEVAMVDQLVRAGADVRATNRYGVAPISLAATNGSLPMIERLLKAGADANMMLPGGETVLMTAARTGRPEAVKALLLYGADPNGRESARGQTALMWAAAENNVDAIKVLVEGGADLNLRTGGPATQSARQPASGGAGVFTGAVNAAPATGAAASARPAWAALHFAVQLGQLEAVRALLDAGADVNDALPDGTAPLVLATQNGHWELAAFIVERGADVNASQQGWTALHQIVRLRRTNIGFLPPPVGKGNMSSLDLVRKLLARGATVNARMTRDFRDGYRNRLNRVGATPFLLASKNVDTELMQVLLAGGADPLMSNADKTTPLMVAAGVDLWNPGEDGGTTPEDEPEALAAVRMLVELGNDVTATNDRGETALHGAAYRGAQTIVRYLVEKGAKLDARSNQGWTPWTIANGVFYTLFYKEQRPTADLLAQLMAERGISTEGMADDGRACFDCGRNVRVSRDAEGNRIPIQAPAAVPRTDDVKPNETRPPR